MSGVVLTGSRGDGHGAVSLRGDLDVTGAADAEAILSALLAPGRSLVIDISALDFLDCASLAALLRVQQLARRGGGDVVLVTPSPQVRRLLALTGKDEALLAHPGVAACLAGAARPDRPVTGRSGDRTRR